MLLHIGKASISNDGATIMKLLDVVHPAAKTLVEIAKSQDSEVLLYEQFLIVFMQPMSTICLKLL